MSRARILADYVSGGTTAAEFDYLDGVTSNIQTQFTAKAPLASPTFTGTVAIPNVANLETAVVANTAKVTNYNQTLADINALDVTELGTVTSGVIGSGVTGYTGIKNFSYWYLNTSFGFSSGNNVWVSHWEEMQATRGYTSLDIGGAMAGPSSGVFTFPSEGYWLIIFSCGGRGNSAAPTVTANIETAVNAGSGDTYLDAARGFWYSGGDATKTHTTVHFIFDVTSVTTHKCRFSVDVTAATFFECNGILQQNGATFIRLGDT